MSEPLLVGKLLERSDDVVNMRKNFILKSGVDVNGNLLQQEIHLNRNTIRFIIINIVNNTEPMINILGTVFHEKILDAPGRAPRMCI